MWLQGIAFRGHSIPELQKVLPKVDQEVRVHACLCGMVWCGCVCVGAGVRVCGCV
jgi:hypothetical protein